MRRVLLMAKQIRSALSKPLANPGLIKAVRMTRRKSAKSIKAAS